MSAKVKRKQRREEARQSAVKKVAGLEAALADAHARRLNAEQEKERALAEERKTTLELLNEQTMLRSRIEELEGEVSELGVAHNDHLDDLLKAVAELETMTERARVAEAEAEELSAEDRDSAKLRRRLKDAKDHADELGKRLNRAEAALAEFRRTTVVLPVRRGAA
jgi:predicted RNase H-like nuclease (RuvC/YqgF family)